MPLSYTFPASHRLSGPLAFAAVYDAKTRDSRGPLTLYSLPNNLPHSRLGLSVSRRVGNAVRRNRIKRMLRESFRLMQHDLPGNYDLVIVVRPHEALPLTDYQKLLSSAIGRLHKTWARRLPRQAGEP